MKWWTLAILLLIAPCASAQTAQERYVEETITRGEVSDVAKRFTEADGRALSAAFLDRLISANDRASRRGIRIRGAVIEGAFDLSGAVVPVDVTLENCVFKDDVNLSHTEWKRDLSLNGSVFRALDISYTVVAGSLWLQSVEVAKRGYFSFLHVGRALEAERVKFLDEATVASFNSLIAGAYARFDDALFAGGADLVIANIGTNLYLAGARFTNPAAPANLDKMTIGDGVSAVRPAIFDGPVSFSGTRTVRDFSLPNARFRNEARAVDLTNMTIGGRLSLAGATFSGPAQFTSTIVHLLFTLDDAHFDNATSAPLFNLITVQSIMRMVGTRFGAGVDLIGARLEDDLNAARMTAAGNVTLYRAFVGQTAAFNGATFDGELDISYATIGRTLNLSNAHLRHAVDLRNTDIGGDSHFESATLAGNLDMNGGRTKGDLLFEKLTVASGVQIDMTDYAVGRDLSLHAAVIGGSVDMQSADVRGAIIADEAKFTNPDAKLSLNSVTAHGLVNLSDARFAGEVDFAALTTDDLLDLTDAEFSNADKDLNWDWIRTAGNLVVRNAVVKGKLSVQLATIGRDIEASGAHFLGSAVDFLQLHVSGDVTFDKAEFAVPPTFTNAAVGGYFSMTGVVVRDSQPSREFSLNSIRVGRFINLDDVHVAGVLNMIKAEAGTDILIRRATIGDRALRMSRASSKGNCIVEKLKSGGLDVSDGAFYNLQVRDSNFVRPAEDDLLLTRAAIERNLELENISARRVAAGGVRVSGTASLRAVRATSQLVLDNSYFDSLELRNLRDWQPGQNVVHLHAMTFREITTGNGAADSEQLVSLLDSAAYSPAAYAAFQQYYERQGMAAADRDVFVHFRRRAAREEGTVFRRVWSAGLDVFVLFGKSPQRAFGYALIFVLLGTLIFERSRMSPQKPEFEAYHYSPIWYSLDRLIPVADLGMKNVWAPRQTCGIARNYMRFHILVGYVLITIGLAALTGLVK